MAGLARLLRMDHPARGRRNPTWHLPAANEFAYWRCVRTAVALWLQVSELQLCPDLVAGLQVLSRPHCLLDRQQVCPGLAVREDGRPPRAGTDRYGNAYRPEAAPGPGGDVGDLHADLGWQRNEMPALCAWIPPQRRCELEGPDGCHGLTLRGATDRTHPAGRLRARRPACLDGITRSSMNGWSGAGL